MHKTLHPDILGYIDEERQTKDTLFLKGWSFFSNPPRALGSVVRANIYNKNGKTEIKTVHMKERQDVVQFYQQGKNLETGKLVLDVRCGWEIEINQLNEVKKVHLELIVPSFLQGGSLTSYGSSWNWIPFFEKTIKY